VIVVDVVLITEWSMAVMPVLQSGVRCISCWRWV